MCAADIVSAMNPQQNRTKITALTVSSRRYFFMIPKSHWMRGYLSDGRILPIPRVNLIRTTAGLAPLESIIVPEHRGLTATIQPIGPARNSQLTQRAQVASGSQSEKKSCCKPSGPGSELGALLKSLGIRGCGLDCEGYSRKMDAWGPQGCREHRQEIIDRIKRKRAASTWANSVKAGLLAVVTGLAFRIDVDHPIEWLVDEAIRRAEEKQDATCPQC